MMSVAIVNPLPFKKSINIVFSQEITTQLQAHYQDKSPFTVQALPLFQWCMNVPQMVSQGCPRQPLPNIPVYWGPKILPLKF
jgi:hypothetical protein